MAPESEAAKALAAARARAERARRSLQPDLDAAAGGTTNIHKHNFAGSFLWVPNIMMVHANFAKYILYYIEWFLGDFHLIPKVSVSLTLSLVVAGLARETVTNQLSTTLFHKWLLHTQCQCLKTQQKIRSMLSSINPGNLNHFSVFFLMKR